MKYKITANTRDNMFIHFYNKFGCIKVIKIHKSKVFPVVLEEWILKEPYIYDVYNKPKSIGWYEKPKDYKSYKKIPQKYKLILTEMKI